MADTICDYIQCLDDCIQRVQEGDFDFTVYTWRRYQLDKPVKNQPGIDPMLVMSANERKDSLLDAAGFFLAQKAESLGLDSTPFVDFSKDRCQRVRDAEPLLMRMLVKLQIKSLEELDWRMYCRGSTPKKFGSMFGISPRTFADRVADGSIPAIKISDKFYHVRLDFIESQSKKCS